jgi:hypothetical protein
MKACLHDTGLPANDMTVRHGLKPDHVEAQTASDAKGQNHLASL